MVVGADGSGRGESGGGSSGGGLVGGIIVTANEERKGRETSNKKTNDEQEGRERRHVSIKQELRGSAQQGPGNKTTKLCFSL